MALNITVVEKFRYAFEQKCFRIIIEAYQSSLDGKVIKLDWHENDISSELHQHIKRNPLRLKWKVSSNVESHITKDIPKVKGFANKFPRIDFRLTSFISSLEYEYFFEAKRLKEKDSGLKREYINEGIDRFTTNKYSNGSMIGYLLEGNLDKTVEGINKLLKKDKRKNEVLNQISYKLHNSYYESEHSGVGTLKHLIFDFTTIVN